MSLRTRALLFAGEITGPAIDLDGMYGPQSPDLVVAYVRAMLGTNWQWPGTTVWASQLMDAPEMNNLFVRLPKDAEWEVADIAVFGPGQFISMAGTVGVVMRDKVADPAPVKDIVVLTQTPGPAGVMLLPAASALGFWRLKEALR